MSRRLVVMLAVGLVALVPPALEAVGKPELADAVREVVTGAGLCPQPKGAQ
jgi:hypothetical protein